MGVFKKGENPDRGLVRSVPVEIVLLGREYHEAQKEACEADGLNS